MQASTILYFHFPHFTHSHTISPSVSLPPSQSFCRFQWRKVLRLLKTICPTNTFFYTANTFGWYILRLLNSIQWIVDIELWFFDVFLIPKHNYWINSIQIHVEFNCNCSFSYPLLLNRSCSLPNFKSKFLSIGFGAIILMIICLWEKKYVMLILYSLE